MRKHGVYQVVGSCLGLGMVLFLILQGCQGRHNVDNGLHEVKLAIVQTQTDVTAINHVVGITYSAQIVPL